MKLSKLIQRKKKDPTLTIPMTHNLFVKHHDSTEDASQPDFTDVYDIQKTDKIEGLPFTYKCTHKQTKTIRSVKVYKRATREDNFWKEVTALRETQCPGVVDIFESFANQKYLYLVMDNLDHVHQLVVALAKSNNTSSNASSNATAGYTEIHVAKLLKNILEILVYLHKVEIDKDEYVAISHGQINAKSNLIEKVTDPASVDDPRELLGWHVLVNFEMATIRPILEDGKTYGTKMGDDTLRMLDGVQVSDVFGEIETGTGPSIRQSRYNPPEFMIDGATPKGDIYSCGVLAYYLLKGEYPYKSIPQPSALQPPNQIDLEGIQTPELKTFIYNALQMNPDWRPAAPDALQQVQTILQVEFANAPKHRISKDVLKRLKADQKHNKLKEAVQYWMTTTYLLSDDDQYDELLKVFQTIDVDQNQVLSKEELWLAFELMDIHLTQKELDTVLHQMDLNQNGQVELHEFLVAAADWTTLKSVQKVRAAFSEFDVSNTNSITADDLREIFNRSSSENHPVITHKAAQAMIDKADTSGQGKLSFADFYAMLWNEQIRDFSRRGSTPARARSTDSGKQQRHGSSMERSKMRQRPSYMVTTHSNWQADVDEIVRFEERRFREGYGWGVGAGIFR